MHTKSLFIYLGLILITLIAGCRSAPDPNIELAVAEVNEVNLRDHIEQLTTIDSRFSYHENSVGSLYLSDENAQTKKLAYLSRRFEEYGYRVQQPTFTGSTLHLGKAINLIAFKEGKVEPHRVLELGAHYDTIANPGADDNCSGIAGVLEAARILADIPTERSIRFCLYDLEEVFGGLGSRGYVNLVKDKALCSPDEVFDGAIVLETIGYAVEEKNTQQTPVRVPLIIDPPKTGNFILVVGNWKSGSLGRDFERSIETYVNDLDYFSLNRLGGFFKDAARSDHSNYWQVGLPAIMITDTANFRNPNYHKKSDTIETLNFTFLSQVVQATVGTLLEYARPISTEKRIQKN